MKIVMGMILIQMTVFLIVVDAQFNSIQFKSVVNQVLILCTHKS